MAGLTTLLAILGVEAFFALVIVVLNPERWSPRFPEEPPPPRPITKTPTARRSPASSFGIVLVALGAILMMLAERPELRSRSGRTLSALGQGGTAAGVAILGSRVIAYARRRGGKPGQGAHDRPAEEEPDAQADGPVPLTIVLAVAPGSDLDRVREILTSSLDHEHVMPHPRPEVHLSDAAEARIELAVKVWVGDRDVREQVTSDLNFRIYKALRAARVELVPTRSDPDTLVS